MPTCPPLPLSQQILAWLLRALGFGDEGFPTVGVSASTLKNARRGEHIPRSWDDLLRGCLTSLRLPAGESTVREFAEVLRRWDERIGMLDSQTNLPLGERLHMPLTLAISVVGARLGALMALMARVTASSIDDWKWILRPLDRRIFGHVVVALIERRKPEWKTRRAQTDGLAQIVDGRTYERWRRGEIAVPNTDHVVALGEALGPGAETMLRIARALSVLREDLTKWLGKDKLAEWSDLVALVGEFVARHLHEPGVLAWQLRDLATALSGPHAEDARTLVANLWPEPWRSATSAVDLAASMASLADVLDRGGPGADTAARLALLHQCYDPHGSVMLRISTVFQAQAIAAINVLDWVRFIEAEWMMRSFLHFLAEHDEIEVYDGDGPRTPRQIPAEAQASARKLLDQYSRFSCDAPLSTLDPEILQLFAWIDPRLPAVFIMRMAESGERGLESLLDPTVERLLPDEAVRASRTLSLARVRRLAESGQLEPALALFRHHQYPIDDMASHERRGFAEVAVALAHACLDGAVDKLALLSLDPDWSAEGIEPTLRKLTAFVEGALATEPGEPEAVDRLVLSFSVKVRLGLFLEYLGVEDPWGPARDTWTQIREALDRSPTHGRAWASAAIGDALFDENTKAAEAKAVHFGAQEYLASQRARLQRDFGAFEGIEPDEPCPDCGGTGIRLDPPDAIADEVVLCTCIVFPDHWRGLAPE